MIQTGTQVKKLIQVCWNAKNHKTREREVRSLLKASRKLRCTQLLIITYEEEHREAVKWFGIKEKIEFIPAWKWIIE